MEESELLRLLHRGDPAGLEALIVRYTPYVSAVAARILPGLARAAEEMGMNLSTAKSRLRRGRERLKEALRKAGYDVEEN